MNAIMCDRCGVFYFKNERYHPRDQRKTAFTGLETRQSWGESWKCDLCDDCQTAFFQGFMKERKRDVQTDRG